MADQHRDDERQPTTDELNGAQVGHIAYSDVLALLAETATMLVPTAVHRRRGAASLTRSVVELRRIVNELLARAITTDRLDGDDWADIAAAINSDPDVCALQYAHLDWQHLASDPRATWQSFHKSCPQQIHDFCADDPATAAHRLDVWYHNHADPREAAPAPKRAVTTGL